MTERKFNISDPVLHLPVVDSEDMWYVKITCGGSQLAEFYIALTDGAPDFYCPLYLDGQSGREVTLSCADDGAPDSLFDGIVEGGSIESRPELYPDMYSEPTRQQVHFSSRRGWLNDPNGLVYVSGAYHMCYQHNPFGPNHGAVNVSWGLAVSADGVHFTEYPDAIRPRDPLTHIASGSAIVDEYNVSGLGSGTILAAYTALESGMKKGRKSVGTRGQMLEYSTDGGYHFKPIVDRPIIPVPAGEWWRDPKILRIDERSLCIAVYETFEGRDCVSFYSSTDCVNWEFRSRAFDFFECPDLFSLPVAETGETLWVLYGGDGVYRVGRFENFKFTEINGGGKLDYGDCAYAGQTWNSHPDSAARYHIAWMRDLERPWQYDPKINDGTPFSQSMTLVCRFTLHKTPLGYRLFRAPVDALTGLRKESGHRELDLAPGDSVMLPVPGEAEVVMSAARAASLRVCGAGFDWSPDDCELRFTSGNEYRLASPEELRVRVIADRRSVELFVNGELSATFSCPDAEKPLSVGAASACRLWELASIWDSGR